MRSINDLKTDKAVRRLLKVLNDNGLTFKEWFKLRVADKKSNLKKDTSFYSKDKIKSLVLTIYRSKTLSKEPGFKITDLKVNGNDVMKTLNIPPGIKVGMALKKLLDLVIENPEHNNKDTLIQLLLKSNYEGDLNE